MVDPVLIGWPDVRDSSGVSFTQEAAGGRFSGNAAPGVVIAIWDADKEVAL